MRSRPGRFVGYKDIEDVAYEVDLNLTLPWTVINNQHVRTRFIRDNCRRGNWSKVPWVLGYTLPDGNGNRTAMVRYLFVDQEDAMHFKMRFG